MTIQFETRPTSLMVRLATFAGLALLGGVAGYLFARFVDLRPGSIGWEDGLAFVLGFALIALAAMAGFTMIFRREAIPPGTGTVQIVVFALAGLMFLAPMVATDVLSPGLVFAGVVAAFALQTTANVIAWRRSDEMMRRVMTETSTIAFWGLQSAFFLYAAAERMALIQPISPWGLTGILMAVYLVSSIVPSMRRGLA